MDYLKAACKYLGIEAAQVRKHRIEGDSLVLVVDMGIKGCPKYAIPLSDLTPEETEILVDAVYEVDATAGAKRQARMSNIDLTEVAQWAKGKRITVNTVREFVKERPR